MVAVVWWEDLPAALATGFAQCSPERQHLLSHFARRERTKKKFPPVRGGGVEPEGICHLHRDGIYCGSWWLSSFSATYPSFSQESAVSHAGLYICIARCGPQVQGRHSVDQPAVHVIRLTYLPLHFCRLKHGGMTPRFSLLQKLWGSTRVCHPEAHH